MLYYPPFFSLVNGINNPMSNIFKELQIDAFRSGVTPRTVESREWFRKRAQSIRRTNRNHAMKSEPITLAEDIRPGAMVMFFYQPKHKDTLPYYDGFPLTVIVDSAPGGFYGLNLHYLPPLIRAKFLDGLMDTVDTKGITENSRFALSYEYLKRAAKLKYFKPCFKHYLTDHVRSRFGVISAPEWEIAAFLPMADWQKKSGHHVYQDSRKMF
jgi:hypothetical protein